MADPILIDKNLFLQAVFTPAVVNWNRLEGRPRKEDFSRSLRAEVRDALWMLCRQWQFGEFRGENAGSAVTTRVQLESGRVDSYAAAGDASRPCDDSLPLETQVEREPVPLSLHLRVQIGRHFVRLVGGLWGADIKTQYLSRYPIQSSSDPEKAAYLASDTQALAYFSAVTGRLPDGANLLSEIAVGRHEQFISTAIPSEPDRNALRAAAAALTAWFSRVFSVPATNELTAWQPRRLEYRFACGVPSTQGVNGRTMLDAAAYPGGRLDWYAFDVAGGDTTAGTGAVTQEPPLSFVPAPVEFAGMPNPRWWQFEDRKTNFGGIRASTTDLPLLMLAEFVLIYGNDWMIIPYDLAAGSFARIRGTIVTDVFGVRTFVRPAGSRPADSWQHWNVYNLHSASGFAPGSPLLLLHAVGDRQEGAPVETITLTRDEMANMVFAIEETIPGEIGTGVGGTEAFRALERHLLANAVPSHDGLQQTEARIRYVAGTTVPENWIPFLPVQVSATSGDIALQRGRMARILPGAPSPTVAPRGDMLRVGLDRTPPESYLIEEEEVPSGGTRLTRAFQRARWYDGRVCLWLGRQKTYGRGEGDSGLAFDRIEPITD